MMRVGRGGNAYSLRLLMGGEGVLVNSKFSFFFFSLFLPRAHQNISLALAEMKILLQKVYSRFITTPDETMREEDMEMADQLISSRPAGLKCLLKFEPIDGQEVVI